MVYLQRGSISILKPHPLERTAFGTGGVGFAYNHHMYMLCVVTSFQKVHENHGRKE